MASRYPWKPVGAGEGILRPGDDGNPSVAQPDQVLDGHPGSRRVVHVHVREVPLVVGPSESHEGEVLFQKVADAGVIPVGFGDNEAVHPSGEHQFPVGEPGVSVLGLGESEDVVALELGGLGDAVEEGVQDGVPLVAGDVVPGVAEGVALPGPQATGDGAGPVAQFGGGGQDPGAGLLADRGTLVEDVGDGGDGDPRPSGDIPDGDGLLSGHS
jgi:hypothetical protein